MLPDAASPSHVFCTSCKVEFAFGISWPCRGPVPRWGCHPQSQTLCFDRWICYPIPPAGRRSWALQPLSDPFSFHGVPVVHARSQCLLSVSTLLYNFSFHKCHQVSGTSSRHICTAQCSVLASCAWCSVIPPYPGRQRRCWEPYSCMSTVLAWADVPHCSNELIPTGGISRCLLPSLLLCSVDTPHRYHRCFSVLIPTHQPLQFHPKMGVERSPRC